jgi:hypothetical protein
MSARAMRREQWCHVSGIEAHGRGTSGCACRGRDAAVTHHESFDDLLHRDHYTPVQLAALLGMSPQLIRQEVRAHRLPAYTVDHHVIDIRREDIVHWLRARG